MGKMKETRMKSNSGLISARATSFSRLSAFAILRFSGWPSLVSGMVSELSIDTDVEVALTRNSKWGGPKDVFGFYR